MELVFFLGLLLCATAARAATPAEWRSRSIYQLLTDRYARTDESTTAACNTTEALYCGGTWQGVIEKLDYIHNMGFTAVWISPITLNLAQNTYAGEAYHGYWQQDIYSLNSNFGTADDLKNLATALHEKGMYLMVDVVVNDFAWAGDEGTVDYSVFTPFNDSSYFHPYCPITQDDYNYNQTAVEDCWVEGSVVSLVDVNTTQPEVISTYYSWIESLVSEYSIDGLRIDTVRQVQKSFWSGFNSAAGVYSVGEVFDGDPSYTCDYQNYLDGVLNYPLYFPLLSAFSSTSGDISSLANMVNTVKSECKDSTLLGTFLENHDNARFPSYTSDLALARNAIAFTILADGIPIIYEGQEQHYSGGATPANREAVWLSGYETTTAPLYTFIASVNQLRNEAIYLDSTYLDYKAYPIYTDSSTIAMRKGFDGHQVIGVFTNLGSNGANYTLSLSNTGYVAGETVLEILTCKTVTVDSNADLAVSFVSGAPNLFYPLSPLVGSGICGK